MPIPAGTTESTTTAPTTSTSSADASLEQVAPAASAGARLSDDDLVAGLAELEQQEGGAAPPTKKPDAKPAAAPKDPAAKDPKDEVTVELDAQASKSIEATNRYRAQAERQIQAKTAELAKKEADLAPRMAKLDAYERAVAARDPALVAEALGFGDDLESAAHTLWKMSKSASPADRAAAAQLLKQKQAGSETEQLRQKVAELEQKQVQREKQAESRAFVEQYTTQLTSAVTAEHPLVANALKNAGEAARQELLQLGARMEANAGGNTPSPAEVVKQYEASLRRQAQALGFDPSKLGTQQTTTTTPTTEPGQKKTTATLTSDLGSQTRPRSVPASRDEGFDDTVREIEEMERTKRRA